MKAKIFLADQRERKTNNFFLSQTVFNENKTPFSEIYLLNDNTLAGGGSLNMLVEEPSAIILLPVVGAIRYKDAAGKESLIAAGQLQITAADSNTSFEISNPFKKEEVNFLQLWIRKDITAEKLKPCICTYDVNEFQNSLIQISPQHLDNVRLPFKISIGKFSGRGETTCQPKLNSEVFLFVLEGAFEAEGRLLHARDGLALADAPEIEMEALSNDAIMLMVEMFPGNK